MVARKKASSVTEKNDPAEVETTAYRLLVVDDEKDIRDMLERHFRFMDFDVFSVSDGQEALDVLNQKRCDIVISDIKMPGMNGIELLRRIRKEFPMIRVIMVTGYVNMGNILECMRYGADTCVYKPFEDIGELEKAVSQAAAHINHWRLKLKNLLSMKPDK